MQCKISDTLPGFMMYNEFFGSLKGNFEPIALSYQEKKAVLASITALDGEPWECWLPFRDDFSLSGILREAREYADGRLYVRAEFRRINYDCTWSEPYQLMAVCRKDGTIESYTVFCGSGRMVEPLQFGMSDGWHDWSKCTATDDMAEALAHLAKPGKRQLGVRHRTNGPCDIYVHSLDGRCSIEWFMCCEPWMLSAADLGIDEVEAMLNATELGGLKALGSMRKWRQLDYPGDYRQYGVDTNIDCALKRLLELAKKQGEEMRVKTVLALGIGENRIDKPYAFWIKSGTMTEEQSLLFNVAVNEQDKAKAAKIFAMLALRGHLASQNKLEGLFRFGMGVPVDCDLAVYWHTQAAKAISTSLI